MGKIKLLMALVALISLVGCATYGRAIPQKSNLTYGMAKKEIIKGTTTQDDILKLFGAPNIMTKNKSGEEVWTYDKVSYESSGTSSGIFFIIGAYGGESARSGTRTMTLMITFDDKNVVKDYSVITTAF